MKVVKKQDKEAEIEAAGTPIPAAITAAIRVNNSESLIADFEDEFVIHEVTIEGRVFFIRELDIMSLIDVETQRLTVDRGLIVRRPNREAKLGLALEFAATLMRKDGDAYLPLFTLETVQAFLRKPRAKSLIHALSLEIWRINPEISPPAKIKAAKAVSE